MPDNRRANYDVVTFAAHLGVDEHRLDLPWATFHGDRSSEETFEVTTDDPTDAYLELQAYEVDEYGHEILLNGEPLTGFDLPPSDGWQLWMDTAAGAALQPGENTVQIARDTDTNDSFAVGTLVVHWREPVDGT